MRSIRKYRPPQAPSLLLFLLVLVLAPVALAQGADGGGAGGFLAGLISTLAPVALDLAAMLGLVVLAWAGNYVRRLSENTKHDAFRSALQTLDQIVLTKVTEIYQSAVADLKNAAEDGKLTVEEMTAARDTAIDEVIASLPGWLMSMLKSAVGGGLQDVIDRYIAPAIENAVVQAPVLIELDVSADAEKAAARLELARARIGLSL